jgi:uracil DNA glycosylase
MEMQDIHRKLGNLIEEIYEVSLEELPTNNFRDITIYAEATRNGVPSNKWQHYILKRDRVGFTKADDQFLELLLKTEKLFNITIKDEEAENVKTIVDLENMVTESEKRKNREQYFDAAIKIGELKLILIGQDPYPDKIDNGIAFCKDKINDLNKTCFPTICNSLGIDFNIFENDFNNDGKKLFHHLLTKGIMFMNLSYELFEKGRNRKQLITDYHTVNQQVIDKFPDAVILKLGLNYKAQFNNLYNRGEIIVHPSGLAKGHIEWNDYWEESGRLLKKFNIRLKK